MLKAGAELGFSPASRTRVQVVRDIASNPFARNGVRYNPVYPVRKPWELPADDEDDPAEKFFR
jgi:hypothetical protein